MVHASFLTNLRALLFGAVTLHCGAIDAGTWGKVTGAQWPNGFTPGNSAYAWDDDTVTVYAYLGDTSDVIGLNLLTGYSDLWLTSQLAVGAPVPELREAYGRDSAAPFVFNPLLQRCILFGGMSKNTQTANSGLPLGDTWLFDPSANPKKPWTQIGNGVASPSPRWRSSAAVDDSGVFYVFGGYDQNQIFGDFWSLTFTHEATGSITGTWSQILGQLPPPRFNAGMASAGSKLFLFGGWNSGAQNDLWTYDTKFGAWGQIYESSPSPGARYTYGMAPNIAVYTTDSEILVGPGCTDNDCTSLELSLWNIIKNKPTKLVTGSASGEGVIANARSAMFVAQKQARAYFFQDSAAYYLQLATASCATAVTCPSGNNLVVSPVGTELNYATCCGATTSTRTSSTTTPCPADDTGADKATPCEDFEVSSKDLAQSAVSSPHGIGLVVGGAVVAMSLGAVLLVVATSQSQGTSRASSVSAEGHEVLMQTSDVHVRDAEENVFLPESAPNQELAGRRSISTRAAMVGGVGALAAVLVIATMAIGSGLRGQATEVESASDAQKLALYEKEPCESTIAPCTSTTTSSTTSTSTTTLCPLAIGAIVDAGYVDHYRGWYDTRGAGCCNDYCRWVGAASGGDPSKQTTVASAGGQGYWSCKLAGTTQELTPAGYFGPTFTPKKCGMPCLPALDLTAYANTASPQPDLGYVDKYRGWYDTQGSGCCHDFCRWVGEAALPNPDPSVSGPVYTSANGKTSFFSCLLAGGGPNPVNTPKDYFTTFPFEKCSTPCLPAKNTISDLGWGGGNVRGWYDVQGSGCCNDYCRWTGPTNPNGMDPASSTTVGSSKFRCVMAGKEFNAFAELSPASPANVYYGATFPFKQCGGKGYSG